MPIRPSAAALAVCTALGGCSLGGDDEPKPATGAPKEIAAAIDRLERATRAGDWGAICRDLLSAAALERAGGEDCEQLMGETAGDVSRPEIRLLAIDIEETRAEARVRTRAAGQAAVEDTLVLVRQKGEWRIESLAAG